MKYARLTKEQLEALNHEFARFLATQQITADEWNKIKKEKPHIAEEEIDIFSDLVWERSLEKVQFLEKIDSQSVHCFSFEEDTAEMISVVVHNTAIDLTTPKGIQWLGENMHSPKVEIFTGKKNKPYDKKKEIFTLLQQGVQIADEKLFKQLQSVKQQLKK